MKWRALEREFKQKGIKGYEINFDTRLNANTCHIKCHPSTEKQVWDVASKYSDMPYVDNHTGEVHRTQTIVLNGKEIKQEL